MPGIDSTGQSHNQGLKLNFMAAIAVEGEQNTVTVYHCGNFDILLFCYLNSDVDQIMRFNLSFLRKKKHTKEIRKHVSSLSTNPK
jgi:hypothetical protein